MLMSVLAAVLWQEGVEEGHGAEQQYVEYDEQHGYHTGEEGFAGQAASGSDQHPDEQQ